MCATSQNHNPTSSDALSFEQLQQGLQSLVIRSHALKCCPYMTRQFETLATYNFFEHLLRKLLKGSVSSIHILLRQNNPMATRYPFFFSRAKCDVGCVLSSAKAVKTFNKVAAARVCSSRTFVVLIKERVSTHDNYRAV